MNKKLLRQIIREEITSVEMNDKINEFGELSQQINALNAQLKTLKSRYAAIEKEIRPILESTEVLQTSMMQTEKYLVTITRKGSPRTTVKYKTAYLAALDKVNRQTKKVLEELLASTKQTSQVASTIAVQSLRENKIKTLISMVSKIFKGIVGKVRKLKGNYDKLNKMLEKLI